MLRYIGILITLLAASTAQAGGYGKSYCNSCYVAPVQKVVQPYNTTNIGNLNQFYTPAPYAQQYPVTDAAYMAAQFEQANYNLQAATEQLAQIKQQSQQRLVMVVPQVQAGLYAVQQETTTTAQAYCAPGMQPQQPAEQPKFSQTQQPSLIAACIKCHGPGGKNVKAFDMTGPLDCDQQKAALLAVYAGKMPKGRPVQWNEDQFAQFSDELGQWNPNPPQQTPPQDQPAPAPSPDNGETSAPQEDFSKAISNAGMKLAGQKIVIPKLPPTQRAR